MPHIWSWDKYKHLFYERSYLADQRTQPSHLLTCLTPELVSTGVHGTSKNMFPHSTKVNRIRVLAKKGQRLCWKGLKILGLCCCWEVILGGLAKMNSRAVLLSPVVGFTLGKHNIYRQGWTRINTKLYKKVTLRTSLRGIIDFFFKFSIPARFDSVLWLFGSACWELSIQKGTQIMRCEKSFYLLCRLKV